MLSLQTKTSKRERYGSSPKSPISPLRLESLIYVDSTSSPRTPRTSSLRPSMEPIVEQIETEDLDDSPETVSPLLALPKELRLQIWEYVLGSGPLGIQTYSAPVKKRSARYSFPPPPIEEETRLGLTGSTGEWILCALCRRREGPCAMPREWHLREDDYGRKWGRKSARLNLLLTCRSIYAEFHPLLPTRPLLFQTFTLLSTFLTSISPSSHSHIRSLTIGYGVAYFSHLYRSTSSFGPTFLAITRMPSLSSLTLVLTTDWIGKTDGSKVPSALMLSEFEGWRPMRMRETSTHFPVGAGRWGAEEKKAKKAHRQDSFIEEDGEEEDTGFEIRVPRWEADGAKRKVIQKGLRDGGLLCVVKEL